MTYPFLEFHVSRKARDRYKFDLSLFATNGKVILTNFSASRQFAHKMNEVRDVVAFPEEAVKASEINAMGLIDEMLHFMIHLYRQHVNASVIEGALRWLQDRYTPDEIDETLLTFVEEFPPIGVYRGKMTAAQYLKGKSNDIPNRYLALEEMFILWIENSNPAFARYQELIDDSALEKKSIYTEIIAQTTNYFEHQPPPMTGHRTLLDLLFEPAKLHPHSLTDQLEALRQYLVKTQDNWKREQTEKIKEEFRQKNQPLPETFHIPDLVDVKLLHRPLTAIDFIKEEAEKPVFQGALKAETLVKSFWGEEREPEGYTNDLDWMPGCILIAKNTYVWLEQMSKKYDRKISKLDQIPDEELDTLARWGVNGLWLIGLWERSHASKKIKQLCGNPDAEASAYALLDYAIAKDLGGKKAFGKLSKRAKKRGIHLAGDMVPNHMAMDSKWVLDHPEWFLQSDTPPYPSYTFEGPNVGRTKKMRIYLEDKYYSRKDAAVVFKRVDAKTEKAAYIYHGNDGTNMPWNDTAQLNFLLPEVREAVIKAIIHTADFFSIIRFDAAMVLAKKHYQRLWFPQPGTGGAIASRSAYSMTQEEFDAQIPAEFWREVVDRMAKERPNTLLLAEAFWLMEGYFVRTLGMHRVYNSAFMNMLRNEENAKYRQTIKNILEFDPDIMKRHVNFMSNPDEETALRQFGKESKYFGVCMLMVTTPGLPMFGHGQVEGFHEKYGMEYRRAKHHETPDDHLIHRHEREIFPLLKKRRMFADVENFCLYDFVMENGHVYEDVIVQSNAHDGDRALVVFLNSPGKVKGWIRTSARYLIKGEVAARNVDGEWVEAEELEIKNEELGIKKTSLQDKDVASKSNKTSLQDVGTAKISDKVASQKSNVVKQADKVEIAKPTVVEAPKKATKAAADTGKPGAETPAPEDTEPSPESNLVIRERGKFERKLLVDGLQIKPADDVYCAYRDHITGLEYIVSSQTLAVKGFYVELEAYDYHLYMNFREIKDNAEQHYKQLTTYLNGRGVASIDLTLLELVAKPVHLPFRRLINQNMLERLFAGRQKTRKKVDPELVKEIVILHTDLLTAAKEFAQTPGKPTKITGAMKRTLTATLQLPQLKAKLGGKKIKRDLKTAVARIETRLDGDLLNWATLFSWIFVRDFGKLKSDKTGYEEIGRDWLDEWTLNKVLENILQPFGQTADDIPGRINLIKTLMLHQNRFKNLTPPTKPARKKSSAKPAAKNIPLPTAALKNEKPAYQFITALLKDTDARNYIRVNRFQEVLWFGKELFDDLIDWLYIISIVELLARPKLKKADLAQEILRCNALIAEIHTAGDQSEYQIEKLVNILQKPAKKAQVRHKLNRKPAAKKAKPPKTKKPKTRVRPKAARINKT